MRAVIVRVFGFTVALAVLWGLGFGLSWGVTRRDEFVQRKLEGADRVLYYEFSASTRPRFQLGGSERELSLVTHLVLPRGTQYDPRQEFDYGVVLRLLAPTGQVVWEQRVYTRSRQSKADFIDGVWTRENTFALDPRRQFADDRVLRVSLPPTYPPQSRLEVGLLAPEGFGGLLRVYDRSERTVVDAEVVRLGLSPQDKRKLIDRLTYLPWTALTEIQRWTRLRFQWNRLSAIGEDENSNPTQTVYFTGFRTPPPVDRIEPELHVGPTIARAINIEGPALATFNATLGCDGEKSDSMLRIEDYTPTGLGRRGEFSLCAGAQTWWLGPGLHSLHILADEPAVLEIRLHEGRPFPPPEKEATDLVFPDLTRSVAYRTGREHAPLRYALPARDPIESRTVRVDLRLEATAGDRLATDLLFEFYDEHGAVLERGVAPLQFDATGPRFEVVITDVGEVPLSETLTPRLIAPKAAHELRLSTTSPALVAVKAFLPLSEAATIAAPYGDVPLPQARWRNAPLATRRWWSLRASNHDALAERGSVADVWAQVRLTALEPAGQDGRSGHGTTELLAWQTVRPMSTYEYHPVLERAMPGSDSEGVAYTRLELGRVAVITIEGDGAPEILYHAGGDLAQSLGERVTLHIDGEPMEKVIMSGRGRWHLPSLAPGQHEIRVDAPVDGLMLFIDRTARGTTYRRRTLHRLDERPLLVDVEKPSAAAVYVNAVFYRCGSRRASSVSLALDGGEPQRVRGRVVDRLTVATRELPFAPPGTPVEVVFLTRPSERCTIAGKFPLAMGEDIAPGLHRFALQLRSGEPLWVRFFSNGLPSPADADADEEALLNWLDSSQASGSSIDE